MSEQHVPNFIGIFLGLVNLVFVKLADPHAVSLRRTVKRLVRNPEAARGFDVEYLARAVIERNKEVFDKLAEM